MAFVFACARTLVNLRMRGRVCVRRRACLPCRRQEYKPHTIKWSQVKHESVTGKQMIYPTPDKKNRPIVLMRPR